MRALVRPGTRTTIVWPGLNPSWRLYCATAMRRPALLAGIAPAGRRTRSPVGVLPSRTVRFMSFGNGIRQAREANGSQPVAARRWPLAVGARTSRAARAARAGAFRMRRRLTGNDGCVRAIVVTRHGGPEVLESTRQVDTILLDKTGTVTTGKMALADVVLAPGVGREEALHLVGSLEHASIHRHTINSSKQDLKPK